MPSASVAADWSAAFTRALEINSHDSNALAAKAYYLTLTEWDWKRAGELYRQAAQFGMSCQAANLYGMMYLEPLGKWTELQAFYNAILNTDPYRSDILWDYARSSLNHRAPQEAIALWDRILEAQPNDADPWAGKADAYAARGDRAAARAALEKIEVPLRNPGNSCYHYLHALWALGDRETVMQLVAEYEREAPTNTGYRQALTAIYPVIGENDKALASYETACAARLY